MTESTEIDTEKGPEQPATSKRQWNRFVPKFMTIQVPDVHIDRNSLQRKLRAKYLIAFFMVISIILSSIAVSGCTSNSTSMADDYLLQFAYDAYDRSALTGDGVVNDGAYATMNSNTNDTDLVIRISYFGTCITSTHVQNVTQSSWFCSSNVTTIVSKLSGQSDDPFNGINLMNELRSNIVSPVIFIMSVCITVFAFVTLLAASIRNTSLFFWATGLTLLACFFALVALVWQQVAVDTAKSVLTNLSNNAIMAEQGPVPAGLGWTSVLILFAVSIGIVALVVNENQALIGLQEFGSDFEVSQGKYGQNALTGRPVDESNANYPTNTTSNVNMPTPY